MAQAPFTLPPPLALTTPQTVTNTNTRARQRLGLINGPGLITHLTVEASSGGGTEHYWGLYCSPALYADVTNDGTTTDHPGDPLFVNAPLLRGVRAFRINGFGQPFTWQINARVPPGSQQLYVVYVNVANFTNAWVALVNFQPIPE